MECITTSYKSAINPLFLHRESGNKFPLPDGIIPLTLISDERRASLRPEDRFYVWFTAACAECPFDDIQDSMKSRLLHSLYEDVVKYVPEIRQRYFVFVEGVPFRAGWKICSNKREVVETIVWNETTQRRLFAFPESKIWLVPHCAAHDFMNGCVAIVYEGNITAISQYWDLPLDFGQTQMENIADLALEFWKANNHKSFPLFTPAKQGNLVLHLAYDTELRKLVLVAPEDLPITGRAGLFDVEKDWELLSDPGEVSLRRVLRDSRDF